MTCLELNIRLDKGNFRLSLNEIMQAQGITVIWGESGSGKSLLLRSIAGYENVIGKIRLNDQTLLNDRQRINIKPFLRRIGYVDQNAQLFPHLTVKQNLNFAYKRAKASYKQQSYSFADVVAVLQLEPLLEQKPATLSGGERQRCVIAQSLLSYPRLLLMDEPLSALDSTIKVPIIEFLLKIPKTFSVPIFLVTHAYEELLKLADQVIVIAKGQSLGVYKLDEFCSNYAQSLVPAQQLGSLVRGEQINCSEYGLSKLSCGSQTLYIPATQNNKKHLEVIIYAKDVSISLSKPEQSSILNLLEARIERIIDYSNSSKLLQLSIGQQSLLSLITLKSFHELNLSLGQKIFAQVKTISFIR